MRALSKKRVSQFLDSLGGIASGDLDQRVPMSERHDELDAIAHAINVLVGELQIVAEGLRRAKEEAEAASFAKTIFLRNMSHEIRTPLTVILGLSELMASQPLSESRIEDLRERIVSNGRALVAILDDLLDLSKVEAAKIDFELQPISVADVVAEVIASFEPEVGCKSLRLFIENEEEGIPKATADPKRLRQILTNVIGNAVKFTARGHVAVRLGQSADRGQVLIDVADTGIGMTKAQSRLLFEPFVQADNTIARRFGGSGLGLALSKRLADGMGGTLEVLDSEAGVGATFRLALPAADADSTVVLDTTRRATRWGAELRGRRILVVEDNEDVRTMFAELLISLGATVVGAADGQEAIDRAHEMTFDAILMDVHMPNVDGLKATRRLRADGVTVPIIALTADAVSEQKAECLAAGCSAYLAKPIDRAGLVAQLRKCETTPKPRR